MTAEALALLDHWHVPNVAAAIVPASAAPAPAGGVPLTRGDVRRVFPIASVSKLLTGYAVMIGVEEGAVELDDPAGPPGSTLRHLLAHTSGYGFESDAGVIATPGTRRVYSNRGIEAAAAHLELATGIPFAGYLQEALLDPLGLAGTELRGSPAHAMHTSVGDLARFVAELQNPILLPAGTVEVMREVQFPGVNGVMPGVGRFDPLDWGLAFERTFGRAGHWAGTAPSAQTFGHFGGAGTFVCVDPVAGVGAVVLTDCPFGAWALECWPVFTETLLRGHAEQQEFGASTT